jgi:hypothetical protein
MDPLRENFAVNDRMFEGDLVVPQRITAPKDTMSISKAFIDWFNVGNNGRNRFVYVWGEVKYMDGLGTQRRTRFCHRYNLAAFDPLVGVYAKDARYHEHGNHTDEG